MSIQSCPRRLTIKIRIYAKPGSRRPITVIHPKILQMIAELWSEDMTLGGTAIHNLLKEEPIKPPGLRTVQK